MNSQIRVMINTNGSPRAIRSPRLWCDTQRRAITAKLRANMKNSAWWLAQTSASEVLAASCGMSTRGSTSNVMAMATTASANAINRAVPSELSTTTVCQFWSHGGRMQPVLGSG